LAEPMSSVALNYDSFASAKAIRPETRGRVELFRSLLSSVPNYTDRQTAEITLA